MVHGSGRVALIYIAGVVAGSLGTSVFDTDVYLVGASGGVYALLAAHLANVLLNYNNMQCGILRLFGIFAIGKLQFINSEKLIYFKKWFIFTRVPFSADFFCRTDTVFNCWTSLPIETIFHHIFWLVGYSQIWNISWNVSSCILDTKIAGLRIYLCLFLLPPIQNWNY